MDKKQRIVKTVLAAAGILLMLAAASGVSADDFNYGAVLAKLASQKGYADLQPHTRTVSVYEADTLACWDARSGIIGAEVVDMNNDGIDEMLLFYMEPTGDTGYVNAMSAPTVVYMDLYTNDGTNAIQKARIALDTDTNLNYISLMVGLMDMGGRKFVHVQSNFNAYVATGADLQYLWYGYDGNTLRPVRGVGKSAGGSSEIAYAVKKFTDAENYESKLLWAGDDYLMYHEGEKPLIKAGQGDIGQAVRLGFSAISLPDAGTVTEPYAEYRIYTPEDQKTFFPSYWWTTSVKKCFWYSCFGKGDYTTREMTVTIRDETGVNPNNGVMPSDLWGTHDTPDTVSPEKPGSSSQNTGDSQQTQNGERPFGTGTALPDEGSGIQAGGVAAQDTRSEYLFEDANIRYLTQADVSSLTAQAACYAKNEIYARHGRKFVSVELQQYFNSKSWYNGTIDPNNFPGSVFNDYELKNIEILKNREFSLAPNGYALDQAGYDINAVGTASRKGN